MSNDVIELNGKEYKIKHYLTVKEVKELIKREQYARNEASKGNLDPTFELWSEVLNKCLGLTLEELENMHYKDAEMLYIKVLEMNRSVPLQ
jgi:hypothetical protein